MSSAAAAQVKLFLSFDGEGVEVGVAVKVVFVLCALEEIYDAVG